MTIQDMFMKLGLEHPKNHLWACTLFKEEESKILRKKVRIKLMISGFNVCPKVSVLIDDK